MKNLLVVNKKLTIILLLCVPLPLFWNVIHHALMLHQDEVCCVNLSCMSISEMYKWIGFDSYGLGFPVVLKIFGLIFGYNDITLRYFGFSIQIGMLVSLFFLFSKIETVPVYTLLLLLVQPVCINYTSNMRAWGLGIVLLVLLMYFLYSESRNYKYLFIISLLTCQTTYYNCVMLFCLFAPFILIERNKKLLYIGILCALSMLIYIPCVTGETDHYNNLKVYFGLSDFIRRLYETVCLNHGLSMMVVISGTSLLVFCNKSNYKIELMTIGLAVICHFLLLKKLSYPTSDWYYMPLIVVVCITLDKIAKDIKDKWKYTFLLLYCIYNIWPCSSFYSMQPQYYQSFEMSELKKRIGKDDLLIVLPWETAIMAEYDLKDNKGYEMITIPPGITNNCVTRFDEEAKYMDKHPIPDATSVCNDFDKALKEGRRVFILTFLPWNVMHPKAPTVEQLKEHVKNTSNSYYYDYVLDEQFINHVQSLSDVSMYHIGNLLVFNDHQ